jgi:acetyl esterase/lipase
LLPCFFLVSFFTEVKTTEQKNISSTWLTDLQGVKYASGLTDWKGKKVDSLVMDIYYPTGAKSDKKYPLLLFCHAGGFAAGNRFNVSAISDEFAEEGFVTVALDYRTGYDKGNGNCTADTATMVDSHYRAVQDAKACLRFLVGNANLYHIDTSAIFIGGSSAGAALALESSYLSDSVAKIYYYSSYQRLGSLETSGNNYTNKYTIKAIIDMWGSIFSLNVIDTKYRSYPTIIFKGSEDGGIPDSAGYFQDCTNYPYVYAGPAIYDKLQNEKTAAVYHYLPEATHPAYDDQFCVQQAACFLNAVMAKKPYSGKFSYYAPSCR